jgi:hypothetical protein
VEQLEAERQEHRALPVGEKSEVADTHEAAWQQMEQESLSNIFPALNFYFDLHLTPSGVPHEARSLASNHPRATARTPVVCLHLPPAIISSCNPSSPPPSTELTPV